MKINLGWNTIDNATYNVYIKDMYQGSEDFVLVASNLNETEYEINVNQDINLEVYVSAIVDGHEKIRSDIKVFK